jgi:autotransporter-associated beta strand protein
MNIMAVILAASNLTAGTLTWDKDPATVGIQDGGGTWNGTTNTWWNGTVNTIWSDGSDVVFGSDSGVSTGGTITISGISPTVNSMTFMPVLTTSYTLSSSTINLANAATPIMGSSATISSVLAGIGKGIDRIGGGYHTLQGANTYTGVTKIEGGGGRLYLSGANGSVLNSASINISNGGVLFLGDTSNNNLNRIGDVDVNMGLGYLGTVLKTSSTWSEHTGQLKVNDGANTISTSLATSGFGSTLTFSNLIRTAGATVFFYGPGLGVDSRNVIKFDSTPTLVNGIIGGWATHGVSGGNVDGWATYDATYGVQALASYQTGSESVWVSTDNVQSTANQTLTANRTINSLFMIGGVSVSGAYTLTVTTGGIIIYTTTGSPTLGCGSVTAGTTADAIDLVVHRYGNQNFYFNSQITDNAAGGKVSYVIVNGTVVNQSSVNSYSGDTIVNSGYLQFRNGGTIPNGVGKGNVIVRSGATLDIYGKNQTINGLSGEGTVTTVAGSTVTLTVGANDATSSFSGTLTDQNRGMILKKIGTGTLTLTGANTYSGGTTISNGVLAIAKTNALGTGAIALSGGTLSNTVAMISGLGLANIINLTSVGTLDTSAGNLLLTGAITNNGSMTKIGANGLLICGAKTGTGALTVSAGYLGGTNIWAGTVTNLAMITAADTNTIGSLTVSNLVLATDSTLLWNYDNTNADVIHVTGTLTLPDVATVQVSRVSGKLPPLATLATYNSLAGSSNLQNWKVVGDSVQPRTYVRLNNNEVQLVSPAGTMISIF